jgi:hypothetical protein
MALHYPGASHAPAVARAATVDAAEILAQVDLSRLTPLAAFDVVRRLKGGAADQVAHARPHGQNGASGQVRYAE